MVKFLGLCMRHILAHQPVRVGPWWTGQREIGALRTVAPLWTCSSYPCAEVAIWVRKVYALRSCTV